MTEFDNWTKRNSSQSAWYERVSKIFDEMRARGKSSEDIFLELLDDLKRLARMKLAREPAGASMHASRLLSDLYFRLFANRSADDLSWDSAGHFVAYITKAMKSLLVDHARQFASRGGKVTDSLEEQLERGVDIAATEPVTPWTNLTQQRVEHAIFVDQLLDRLEEDNPQGEKASVAERQASIVRLRLFLGYTEDETAAMLDCSSETVTKEFRKAKAKIASYAQEAGPSGSGL
jgi:RNA polymerase sigma factor (sigma-70 family)